jgi:DNA-binding response OmpR family regulator
MRAPQIVVCESDRWAADLLRGTAELWQWPLRELRDEAAIVRALGRGGPSVLVLEIGGDLERDLALLARLTWLCPQASAVAVSPVASAELTGLAWDLGADYVLAPPLPRDALLPVVLGLMETASPKTTPTAGPDDGWQG